MIVYDPEAIIDLAEYGIHLPLLAERYRQTYEALASDPQLGPKQAQWLRLITPAAVTRKDMARVHTPELLDALLVDDPSMIIRSAYDLDDPATQYRNQLQTAQRPLRELVEQHRREAGGTIETCRIALETRFAYYLGGGFHHAMTARARGFCLVNDIVIAIRKLQADGLITTAWVVDIDAHRGDGTAEITVNDPTIATLSVHMAQGWPLDDTALDGNHQLKPWFFPGTVDIGIPRGQETAYLELLRAGLRQLEVSMGERYPELVVIVDGSDPWEHDELDSAKLLRLPLATLVERDLMVYHWFATRGVPQAYVMAGGYGPNNWMVHAGFLKIILAQIPLKW